MPATEGGTTAGMARAGSVFVNTNGSNKGYCDGHVKWTIEPGGEEQSVWSAVDNGGYPSGYWWDGACPLLLRPWG